VVARAQQAALPVIGYLGTQSADDEYKNIAVPFLQGLKETGYVEGQNVAVEYRWAENHDDRLSPLAADLVRRRVAVIVALGATTALAAKAATQTIPVVFRVGVDPVEIGLVASFNRPAGNLTGIANLSGPIVSKRLALLRELIPAATIATLVNSANPGFAQIETRDLQAAAGVLGVRVLVLNGGSAGDIAGAFATLHEQQAGALLISANAWFFCSARLNHVAGGSLCDTHNVFRPSVCHGRGSFELWNQLSRREPSGWPLCWPHPQDAMGRSGEHISIAALSDPMEPRHDETQNQECERFQPMSRPAGYGRDIDRGDRENWYEGSRGSGERPPRPSALPSRRRCWPRPMR
jgi:hypothetical protein